MTDRRVKERVEPTLPTIELLSRPLYRVVDEGTEPVDYLSYEEAVMAIFQDRLRALVKEYILDDYHPTRNEMCAIVTEFIAEHLDKIVELRAYHPLAKKAAS